MNPFSRNAVRATAVTLAAVAVLGACSRDERPGTTAAAETYAVEHPFGTTDVPVDAARVVVTMTALMDSSVAVGVVPVGAPISFSGLPAYLGLEADAVESLGDSESDLDPEAIAALEPDLILMNVGEETTQAEYETLSAIAPTVGIEAGNQDPRHMAEQVGAALGRDEEMAEVAAAYDARAAALRESLASVPAAQQTVSQVRLRPDHVRMMMEGTNAGRAMTDAGLVFEAPLPGAEVGDGGYYETSLELLPEAVGDYAFVYSTDEGVLESVRSQAIWQEIPAVQNGTAVDVDFEVWMRGQGYLALGAVLDDIAAAFGVEPTT